MDSLDRDREIAQAIIELKKSQSSGKNHVEESFYICDLGKIIEKYEQWKLICGDATCYYAVKCDPDKIILKTMAEIGLSFDCASKEELEAVLDMEVSAERIIFTLPHKPISHIEYARDNGVDLMVFNCIEELEKIHKVCGASFPMLLLRIFVTGHESEFPFGDKFGAKENEYLGIIKAVKGLGMNLIGLSFHCGSGSKTVVPFKEAIALCKKAFDIAKDLGVDFELINFGGGYGGEDGDTVHLREAFKAISDEIKKQFSSDEGREEEIVDGAETKYYYFVGSGVYSSFGVLLEHAQDNYPVILKDPDDREQYVSSIFGPTCSGTDNLLIEKKQAELFLGEYLMWKNMGHYSYALDSGFNGFSVKKKYYVISDKLRLSDSKTIFSKENLLETRDMKSRNLGV